MEAYGELLTLGKLTIWSLRNKITFEDERFSCERVRNILMVRIRNRLLVDARRLALEDFVKRWSKGRVLTVKTSGNKVNILI